MHKKSVQSNKPKSTIILKVPSVRLLAIVVASVARRLLQRLVQVYVVVGVVAPYADRVLHLALLRTARRLEREGAAHLLRLVATTLLPPALVLCRALLQTHVTTSGRVQSDRHGAHAAGQVVATQAANNCGGNNVIIRIHEHTCA